MRGGGGVKQDGCEGAWFFFFFFLVWESQGWVVKRQVESGGIAKSTL